MRLAGLREWRRCGSRRPLTQVGVVRLYFDGWTRTGFQATPTRSDTMVMMQRSWSSTDSSSNVRSGGLSDKPQAVPHSRLPHGAVHQGVYRPYIPDSAALSSPTYERLSVSAPHKWFTARKAKRKVFLHVGPTNSGKTHTALAALRNCTEGEGLFCAPLRLLAWQVSTDLQCSLLTGQERTTVPDSPITACTVEMCDIVTEFEVAVVDEIQLVGDPERGLSFTRALLGLQAKELHLCGEPGVVDLIKRICTLTGDELHIDNYERLSPLKIQDLALGSLRHVREGDCVVVFSRKGVHKVQQQILDATGHKSALVYGSLPPETRKLQASRFNSGECSVLVATDAIGMGLNLSIKRVVFFELAKFDGGEHRALTPREVRQIGGRAGRYGHGTGVGQVAALRAADHRKVAEALGAAHPTLIPTAMVYPPREFMRARFHNTLLEMLQRDIKRLAGFVQMQVALGKKPQEAATDWLAFKIHQSFGAVVREVDAMRTEERLKTQQETHVFTLSKSTEMVDKLELLKPLRLGIGNIQALAEAPFRIKSQRSIDAFIGYAAQHQVGAMGLLQDCFRDPFYIEMFGPIFERYGCDIISDAEALALEKKLPDVSLKAATGAITKHQRRALQVESLEESYQILDLSLWLGTRFGHPEEVLELVQRRKYDCNQLIVKALDAAGATNPKKRSRHSASGNSPLHADHAARVPAQTNKKWRKQSRQKGRKQRQY